MIFTIRKAIPSDAAAIARVQVASWRSSYQGLVHARYLEALDAEEKTLQWQLRLEQGIGVFYIAEDVDSIFGFLAGGAIRKHIEGYDAEVYALYLLDEKQEFGAGKALICAFAQQLKLEDYKSIAVWVLAGNPARGFYEKLGGLLIARDEIEIGGESIPEVAYGWPSISALIDLK